MQIFLDIMEGIVANQILSQHCLDIKTRKKKHYKKTADPCHS